MISSISSQSSIQSNTFGKSNVKKEPKISASEIKVNDKFSAIKSAIQNGTYEIDISKTAKAVAEVIA
ncbi:flagellar biosynthesis anti-sigma factor FlgM [Campylobacter sp. faydin G-140]|uniref:flagellar biosynthesis anti-sigma factor FlgM n=1 Tax=Campylobacter anatolicus TaxID=2829105 RepID=UPI001B96EB25|nr:flagellar biosynthesis anti-sigma factor FlgM [Campylobacter anatolicus]MBR8462749.1 flagellar biosynthesis anti-sigma factor FlgM [Campylobacter anatolicus]MBR8465989.1 flagellar biosynthesis anti-sigma factor FlgM [Campylobacter anatolicus]